jgi:hypothetical protein
MIAPDLFYLNSPECLVWVFDLREPGAESALYRQRDRWAKYSDLEPLDENHVALIIRPGWVAEPVA